MSEKKPVTRYIDRRALWVQRQMHPKTKLSVNYGRIQPDSVDYLRSRHPYIVVFNEEKKFPLMDPPEEHTCPRTGWVLLDYGVFLCTSSGENAFARYHTPHHHEEGGGGEEDGDAALKPPQTTQPNDLPPPLGTLAQQAYHASISILEYAAEKGWTCLHISEGHENMKFAIYAESDQHGISISGFEASETDQQKKTRLDNLRRRRTLSSPRGPSSPMNP